MALEIIPLGGYSEIGRNSVAVRVDDEVVILDLGLKMDTYVEYTETNEIISEKDLVTIGAIPDIKQLGHLKKNVKAILLTHAHLDHVGAVPFIANKLGCDIHGTAFTIEVVRELFKSVKKSSKGKLRIHKTNDAFRVSKKIEVEFISITHSAPQTVMILIKTPYGNVLYANDFKFDNNPTLGDKPNYKRLRELKGKIDCLILDALYAPKAIKMPSEKIAEEMLKDVLLGTQSKNSIIIVSTFSSHIARLRSIVKVAKLMNRKVVFVGRSLSRYANAAEKTGITKFDDVEMVGGGKRAANYLKRVRDVEKKIFVTTGHQGEPKAVLARIVNEDLLPLSNDDQVIFSCKVIPTNSNIQNRQLLDDELRSKGVRLFNDIHVSGHGGKEDHRDFLNMIDPKIIVPTHGNLEMLGAFKELAKEMGIEHRVTILKNGKNLRIA